MSLPDREEPKVLLLPQNLSDFLGYGFADNTDPTFPVRPPNFRRATEADEVLTGRILQSAINADDCITSNKLWNASN